jgi:hypothetical protein
LAKDILGSIYKNTVVQGNPGIGKSYFGVFLLLHLIQTNATVVYQPPGEHANRFLFCEHGVFEGNYSSFAQALHEETTFYIVDACVPDAVFAKTILVTSPRKEIWHEFSKKNCTLRFMSVWSRDELYSCRLLFSDLTEKKVKSLFKKWGGIPRFVLQYASDATQQSLLDDAIGAATDINSLLQSLRSGSVPDGAPHKLIHMHVAENNTTKSFEFASNYVAGRLVNRMMMNYREQLIMFLSSADGLNEYAVLRGQLFEQYAHNVLAHGGYFQVRKLVAAGAVAKDVKHKQFFPRTQKLFSTKAEVEAATHESYLQPKKKTFESVDAIVRPNILFQMKSGQSTYQCKQRGLLAALDILNFPKKVRLFFVVPPSQFETLTETQRYCGTKCSVLTQPDTRLKTIRQYALCVPLTTSQAAVSRIA